MPYTKNFLTAARILLNDQYYFGVHEIPDNIKKTMIAQWALESNWGKSELAEKHKNLAGLKFRKEIDNEFEDAVYITDYCDWEEVTDAYLGIKKIQTFPEVYIRFLCRSVYENIQYMLFDDLVFLRFLVHRGFVASMEGVNKKDIIDVYPETILKIKSNQQFKKLLHEV